MWNIISNISSIVTCLAFLLYIVGHIWTVIKNKDIIYEKFAVIPYDSSNNIEDEDNVLIVDSIGAEFYIESNYGINNINIFKIKYESEVIETQNKVSRELVKSFKGLNRNKLFIRCDLGEVIATTQIEVRRSDYTLITFDLYESGKNGHIIIGEYKYKLTFKGFIYHLCV